MKDEADLSCISDQTLLERSAKWAARHGRKRGEPNWAGVAKVFALGSTFSAQLCRRVGIDPDDTSTDPEPRRQRRQRGLAKSTGYGMAAVTDHAP